MNKYSGFGHFGTNNVSKLKTIIIKKMYDSDGK